MNKQRFASYLQTIVRSLGLAVVVVGLFWSAVLRAETPIPSPSIAVPVSQSSALTGDAEDGEQLWVTYYCYSCHGWSANGGSGPRISNTDRTLESFVRYVRKPARMPPYVNRVMSDQQLADVYEFLLGLPPSPTLDSIPMLKALFDEQ